MALHNLPQQLMPFIGREADINDISTLLDDTNCRLLSLIGAGGMGKTRLSLEIAHRKVDEFADGVYFVPLQSHTTPEDIKMAIVLAIGFQFGGEKESLDQLLDYLSDKEMLLVLDNFEHLLDGADVVARILESATRVKIVVTSREALKLQLEWVRIVTGMSFPSQNGGHNGSTSDTYSAVALFEERARRIQPHFSLEDNLSYVIRICQLVGGMPLGIELAVVWLKTLSSAEIAGELQRNTDMLTAQMRDIPERHQSIRIVFNASWEMLTSDEQSAFMRLSVFRGTPTRQAIQVVSGASLMTLSGLADKALIFPYENGRYQIHELLRQYAFEKLESSDECQLTQDAHSQYYLQFMTEREPDLQGQRQIEALEEITLDFENVRAAWLWAIERKDYESIGGAIEALCMYLHLQSRWKYDSFIITQAQEKLSPNEGETPHPVWGKILSRNHINVDDTLAQLELALEIAKSHNNEAEIGLCLHLMGFDFSRHHNHEESIHYQEVSIPYLEKVEDHYHLAAAYGSASAAYRILGEHEIASSYNRISLDIRRKLGDLDGQVFSLAELSHELFRIGDFVEAERYRREALALARRIGRVWSITGQAWELALLHLFGVQGDFEAAHQVIEETLKYSDAWYGGYKRDLTLIESLFAGIHEDYVAAQEKGEHAFERASIDAWGPIFAWGLMVAASGQSDYEMLRQHTYNLIVHFEALHIRPLNLLGIAFAAIIAAYQDNQPRRATELIALALTHPHSMTGWLKNWALIDRLQQHLETELGKDAYKSAWQRGQALDVDVVVQETITLLRDEPSLSSSTETGIPSAILEANAVLLEPLSERELEVLFRIADGHSNREIAEQLFIGLSTVKKHITHIYGKLAVDSRTQALLKAQELRLINSSH